MMRVPTPTIPQPPAEDENDGDSFVLQMQFKEELLSSGDITDPGTTTATNVDVFARITEATADEIEMVVRILELRGAQPRQAKIRRTCFDAVGISTGMTVVEVGCGSGVVARDVANMVGTRGKVVALDPSQPLLNYASERSVSGTAAPISWTLGFADALPFPDRSHDISLAVTLLSHLQDQDSAVAELRRVTRPGGKVVLFDQDYQTLLFAHSDAELTRRILLHGADYNIVDGWCGRKLPGLLSRHRLSRISCWPFVYHERDASSYLITIAQRFAKLARRHGIITQDEHQRWVGELHDRSTQGTFYASLNYYVAFGVA